MKLVRFKIENKNAKRGNLGESREVFLRNDCFLTEGEIEEKGERVFFTKEKRGRKEKIEIVELLLCIAR